MFLAGDAIIAVPWSDNADPAFLGLVESVRGADVAIVNLELVLHDFAGYGQADSGGGNLAARPAMAAQLAWAGVDMVSGANNHTFDYGSDGVLDTLASVDKAGLAIAGSGPDLQRARAPAYVSRPDGKVALVATASSFVPYGRASRSRPELHGRPGLNPLTTAPYLAMPSLAASLLWRTAEYLGIPRQRRGDAAFELGGLRFQAGSGLAVHRDRWVDPTDLAANIAAVRTAAATSDLVVFSIHAHQQGPWLTDLAHRMLDAGADVVLAHGPHRMLGVELYDGRPIFYCPGDFVFQPHLIERFPPEFYDENGLDDDATVEDLRAVMTGPDKRLFRDRYPWESFGALLRYADGKLREIRLLPLDLGFDRPMPIRGTPRLADAAMGRHIIEFVGELSRPYGTAIGYLEGANVGMVELGTKISPDGGSTSTSRP